MSYLRMIVCTLTLSCVRTTSEFFRLLKRKLKRREKIYERIKICEANKIDSESLKFFCVKWKIIIATAITQASLKKQNAHTTKCTIEIYRLLLENQVTRAVLAIKTKTLTFASMLMWFLFFYFCLALLLKCLLFDVVIVLIFVDSISKWFGRKYVLCTVVTVSYSLHLRVSKGSGYCYFL